MTKFVWLADKRQRTSTGSPQQLVATAQLSAADGMRQSPRGTAGAVEHFTVIGKITEHGTIDRAEIEPGAVGGPQVEARNRTTPMMPGVIVACLSCRLFLAG